MIPAPFLCAEQQPLSVTSTSGNVTFSSIDQGKWPHVRVVNYGSKGIQFNPAGSTAVATSSAAGAQQVYIGAGEDVIFTRPTQGAVMSAICDGSDSTLIAIHIGQGN